MLRMAAVVLAVGLTAVGCGRSAESRAAERAQDACITALAPVADGAGPRGADVGAAVRHADDAAAVDRRWRPLRARLHEARDRLGTAAFGRAVDAVVGECERVSRIVRREQGAGGADRAG